ncbi:MAG TPA: carboxypeptidase regulatory-like domain-containing protein [Bryobacteraceae bacterium]|nr:carboxypeptidase regulatory-like domain-containing protein [Bryobacteraceae bacterium]
MVPRRIACTIAPLCAALFLLPIWLAAQSGRGNITGTVHDSSGASVPGAQVRVTNNTTNQVYNLTTSDTGDYTAADVPVGTYTVHVEKPGFSAAEVHNLNINAGQTGRADVTMQIGQSRQVVEVQAAALQVDSEDSQTAVTVNQTLVNELPLVVAGTVRSPFDLASLTPEVKNTGSYTGFSLGGGQADGYQATLDGVSIDTSRALQKNWVTSNAPSVEAVTQFTVDTNGFKAEYGHASGGVMMFVAKSGTNQLHGSAYEFVRNTDFDANDWFSNRAGKPRQIYKQNDFGFTVGGPVYIPKVYHGKNKTFFFFSYEGFRNRNGATNATATVPTSEMYNGDFSNWITNTGKQIPIYDPTTQVVGSNGSVTRAQFPGNKIPVSLFNPTSVQALKVFQASGVLTPNNGAAPGTVGYINNNYIISNGSNVQPVNKWSIKGDHLFNDKHRISGYYGYDRESVIPGPEGPATLPGLYSNYNDLRQSTDVLRFSWDWTMSPTKFNHFYAGGNNWRQDHKPPQEYIGNWKSKFCLGNVPNCNENLVNLFSGGLSDNYTTWGGQADNGSENTIYSYNDDFTWIHGAHTFKFGGQFQITHYNGFGRQCEAGCAGFSYAETGLPGVTDPNQGGNAFASFLLGYADTGQIDTPRFIGQQFPYFAGFAQDDWRVNKKLVLNLGLRWETNLPPTGLDDRWSDFSPTTPNPGAGGRLGAVIFAGSGPGRQGSRTLADSYFRAFGPHIGFAYSVTDRTVFRGSYARSFSPLMAVSGSTHNMGFTLTQTFPNPNNGINPAFLMNQGMPPWTAPPFINPSVSNGASVSWWQGAETTHPPTTENFNFSIQHQLSSTMLIETAYNGAFGSHLQAQLLDYNQDNPALLTAFGNILQSTAVLNSQVGSTLANQAGITAPFPGFKGTVKQALRPYPQYTVIDTYAGQGDHSGHSTYHSAMVRFEKRYGNGITIQTSYVFSKLVTDADSYWGNAVPVNASGGGGGCCLAADQYNRRLEKSIGQFDVTHDYKAGFVYDLPFGKGRQYLTRGFASWILGNWGINGILTYASGLPVAVTSSYVLPLYSTGARSIPYVTSYNGWQPNWNGGFDPSRDTFLVGYCTDPTAACSGPFPHQGDTKNPQAGNLGFGNMTRYNPKVRQFPNFNENLAIARSFPIKESIRLEFRAEAFNIFNRVRFGTGTTLLQDPSFGKLTSSSDLLNTPRQLQLAMKLYF